MTDITQKMDDLLNKSIEKKQMLAGIEPEYKAIPAVAPKDANGMPLLENEGASALTQKLIDNDILRRGNPLIPAINLGAEAFNSVTKAVGGIGAGAAAVAGAHEAMLVPDEAKAALVRKNAGTATEDDLKLLALPAGMKIQKWYSPFDRELLQHGGYQTNEQRLLGAANAQDMAEAIKSGADYSGSVDQRATQKLQNAAKDVANESGRDFRKGVAEIKEGDVLSGAAKLIKGAAGLVSGGAGAAVDNPMGVTQLVTSQAANVGSAIAFGPAGLAANAAGYGGNTFTEGIEEKRAATGGVVPDNIEIAKTAANATAAAALDVVGDIAMVGAGKALKGVLPNASKVGAEITEQAIKGGAASAVAKAAKTLTAPLVPVAKGAAGEFVTEGAQQYFEEAAKGKDATLEGMLEAGLMGAMAGGAIRTGIEVASLGGKAKNAAVDTALKVVDDKATYKEAVKTKDVSAFTDDSKETFAPSRAIDALREVSFKAKPEERAVNLDKAESIGSDVTNELNAVKEALAIKQDPSKAEEFKNRVAADIAEYESYKDSFKDDPDTLAQISAEQAKAQAYADRTLSLVERAMAPELADRVAEFTQHSKKTAASLEQLRTQFGSKDEVTAALDSLAATKTNTQEGINASSVVLKLAMTTPGKLNEAKVAALVSDTSNGLTQEGRDYLTAWVEARKAAKDITNMDSVSNTVIAGDKKLGFVGVNNYRENITNSINSGNTLKTQRELKTLGDWSNYYKGKAEAVNEAYSLAKQDGLNYYPTRLENGSWEVSNTPSSDSLNIHRGSNKSGLIDRINTEASLVDNTFKELSAAVNVKRTLSNLKNTPKNTPVSPTAEVQGKGAQRSEQPASPRTQAGATNAGKKAKNQKVNTTQTTNETLNTSTRDVDVLNKSSDSKTAPVSGVATASRSSLDTSQSSPQKIHPTTATRETTTTNKQTQNQPSKAEVELRPSVDEALGLTTPAPTDASTGLRGEARGEQDGQTQAEALSPSNNDPQISVLSDPDNYFTQQFSQKKPADVESNPLIGIKDFLTTWTNNPTVVEAFLPMDTFNKVPEAVKQVERALSHFRKSLISMNSSIQSNLARPAKELQFKNKDMVQPLITETVDANGNVTLDMDENVKTAISAAAYAFILDSVNSQQKTNADIADMHGMEEDNLNFNEVEGSMLRKAIAFKHTVINDMGKAIVKSLGIKPNATTGKEAIPLLETAIGVHGFELLKNLGAIRTEVVPYSTVQSWLTGEPETTVSKETAEYVLLNDKDPRVESVKKANKGTGQIITKLFDKEKVTKSVYRTPQKFTQNTLKKSNLTVPAITAKVLQKEMNEAWTVVPEMYEAMQAIGKDNILKIAGFKTVDELHKVNQESAQAQNDNLEAQYDFLDEELHSPLNVGGVNADFYIVSEAWKNHRAGISTQTINPQTSKIHRFAMQKHGWTQRIDFDNSDQMEQFVLNIAAMSGLVKTDQQSDAKSLELFDIVKTNPKFVAAVNTAKKIINKDAITEAEATALADFSKAGEGMMSLQAVMAYAKYQIAADNGASGFEATLAIGVDGKTNGPILSMLANGAANSVDSLLGLMERGGLYNANSKEKSFNTWYAQAGSNDLYQHLAVKVFTAAAANKKQEATLDAFQFFTGKFLKEGKAIKAGRDAIKTPLTSFNFGSSVQKSADNMQNKFEEAIYKSIENALKLSPAEQKQFIADFISNMNLIQRKGYSDKHAPTFDLKASNITMEDLKTKSLFKKKGFESLGYSQEAFDTAFFRAVGKPLSDTFKTEFAVYIDRRNSLTKAANQIFGLYNEVFKEKRAEFINKLMDSGDLPFITSKRKETFGNKVPARDLSSKEEKALMKEIQQYVPITSSMFSILSQKQSDGLYLGKTAYRKSESNMYEAQPTTKSGKSREASVSLIEDAPGAAAMPYNMHSYDSSIMKLAQSMVSEVLNVHDEGSTGLDKVQDMARALNMNTIKGFYQFSPITETIGRLASMVSTLRHDVAAGRITPAVYQNFIENSKFLEDDNVDNLITSLESAFAVKSGALRQITDIDQYTYETGTYQVSEKDKTELEEFLALEKERIDAIVKQLRSSIKSLDSVMQEAKDNDFEFASINAELEQAIADVLEVDTPIEIKTAADLSLTNGIAATVVNVNVDHGSTFTPPTLQKVQAEMRQNPAGGVVAAVNTLASVERAEVVESLSKAGRAIPASMVSPFGEIGASSNETNATMAATLEANPVMDKQKTLALLKNLIKAMPDSPKSAFYRQIFNVIKTSLPDNTRLVYLTPDYTGEVDVTFSDNQPAYTSIDANKTDVFVLSADHKYGAVNFEMLMHELTHAALARTIETASNNKDVQELVDNLNGIMTKAKKAAASMPEFGPAFENIHEFVSWGMSNQDFQDKVLSSFTVKAANAKNPFIKALTAFTNTIRTLLFGDRSTSAATVNGFNQFIKNTTALMEASKAQPSGIKMALAMTQNASPEKGVYESTLLGIFDAITAENEHKNSPAFNARLRVLAADTSLSGLGLGNAEITALINDSPKTSLDIYHQMIEDGVVPAPDAYVTGLPFSPQEAFVATAIQTIMEDVMDRSTAPTDMTFRSLQTAYESARKQLKPKNFLPEGVTEANANAGDMAVAAAVYDSIFNGPKDIDPVARFAAIALANERMATILEKLPEIAKEKPSTFLGKLSDLLMKAVDFVRDYFTGTRKATDSQDRVNILVRKLVRNELALREQELERLTKDDTLFDKTKESVDTALNTAVIKAGNALKKSSNVGIQLAGNTLLMVGGDRAQYMMKAVRRARDRIMKERDGFFATILTEVTGVPQKIEALLRYAKNNEKMRMLTRTEASKFLKEGFKNQSFTEIEHRAITNVFLRTDMQVLANDYSLEELHGMMTDTAKLDAAIKLEETALRGSSFTGFFIGQSKALGMYLATEKVTTEHLLLNAHNIIRAGGTNQSGQIAENFATQYEPVVDRLVSLYAMKYSNKGEMETAARILSTEMQRKQANPEDQGNGVDQILKMHNLLQAESKNLLFQNADALFTKGYLPEINDPNISVRTGTKDEEAALIAQGWNKVSHLTNADNDPRDKNYSLFTRKDGGLAKHETGIISFKDNHGKGSSLSYNNSYDVQLAKRSTNLNAQSMFRGNFDPTKVTNSFMVPTLNSEGNVVNYSYRMGRELRNNLLGRDNRSHVLLGTLASSIQDKVDSKAQNRIAIDALREQYKLEGAENADSFIKFSADSNDAFIREHWDMLPADAKQYIEDTWEGPMYVRADMFNVFFGSRMPSIGDIFNKPAEARNIREKIIATALEGIVKTSYYMGKMATGKAVTIFEASEFATNQTDFRVRQAERMWQEVIKHLKQNIVIKNIDVLLGNISSNISLLVLAGVPLKDIYKHHVDAIKAAEDYQKNFARKLQIEAALDSDYTPTGRYELEKELDRVNSALEKNPAKSLMDAGLMPTIVEDIDTSEDIYSYKSQLVRKTENIVNKIPKGIREVAKQVYMTEDTKTFKFLNRSTQLSDFVAKYTLVKHSMNRKKNPLSQEDALFEASEAFINYDLPSHRYMNYANSVGLVMFTKYYFRIQRMIGYLMKRNPSRAIAMQIMHSFASGLPILFDSFFLNKLGNNPFATGIFQYPGTVGNIATVEGLSYPFK